MPHTTPWIIYISIIPRNDMAVEMKERLSAAYRVFVRHNEKVPADEEPSGFRYV